MSRLNRNASDETQDKIDSLVATVIQIYREEDYDYVVSLAKKGEKSLSAPLTVDDEVVFIKENDLNTENLCDEDLKIAAKIIIDKIEEIDEEIYEQYCK